jgi:hypothetical protein
MFPSPNANTSTQGMKAPKTKPKSIITFVKIINHLFRVPLFKSPEASDAATLPAGYSPPIPTPTRNR